LAHGEKRDWHIGKLTLSSGASASEEFTYEILIFPADQTESDILDFNPNYPKVENTFDIVKGEDEFAYVSGENLLAYFDSSTQDNNSTTKDIWQSSNGTVNCYFKLNNLNYSTNGWIKDEKFDNDNVLKLDG
jgi:hypothetical protein